VNTVDSTVERRTAEAAQARTLLLVLVCFLLGLAVGAFWYYRATNRHSTNVGEAGSKLAESTKAVLKTLDAPVEIRFYSLLDPASTSDALRTFAGRVEQLLSEYEQEAGGKIKVVRHITQSDADARAASSDGVKAFNLDKGDACFLGIILVCKDRKESFPQLQPDWESALEFDLDRALERVTAGQQAPAPGPVLDSKSAAEAASDVNRLIPNMNATSLEEGTRILRDASMTALVAAGTEMENQIKAAQQALSEAQRGKSEAEQQAAMKHLQQVQLEQADKIKQIAAQLQSRLAVFQQLKTGPPPSPSGVK
jgi:hypothetical protein